MSEKRFIQLLQALLTMVDPKSETSAACVKSTLENILALAVESGKADAKTIHIIVFSIHRINILIDHKDDFAGIPGDYHGNMAKQQRLLNMLYPSC